MGYLLIFEGLDGSGKSTQITLMEKFLLENGQSVLTTREPGGTLFGEECRSLFLKHKINGTAELFLALASRLEHIENKIKPALKNGSWVLCDRFTDSTIAYQGWGRGVSLDLIISLSELIEKDLKILKVIFLKISYETARKRIKGRKTTNNNRFDLEEELFFKKVHEGFEYATKNRGCDAVIVDGEKPYNLVFSDLIMQIPELHKLKKLK